jgi:hypothetical protein
MSDDAGLDGGGSGPTGGRDVVVPMRLYKTVTVFSTLIAVVSVVLGFVLLDAATLNGGLVRYVAGAVLGVLGVGVSTAGLLRVFESLAPVFAVLGLACIGFGAGVYILGSRFRAQGMGKSQDDADEASDDG